VRTWLVDRNAGRGSAREQDENPLMSAYVAHGRRLHAHRIDFLEAIPEGSESSETS